MKGFDFSKVLCWATLAMPAIFPLYLLKFEVFGAPVNVVEVAVYVLFLMFVFEVFRKRFFWRLKVVLKVGLVKFFIPVVLLILGAFGGVYAGWVSGDMKMALGIFKGWVLMPILYAIILYYVALFDCGRIRLFRAYMLGALVLGFWALWQVVTGDYITIDMRASGPFESANYLALYIAPAVLISFGYVLYGLKQRKIYGYELLVFLVLAVAMVFSKSYGGLIGLFGGGFVYILFMFKSWWKRFSVVGALVLAGVVVVLLQIGTTKFDDFLAFERQSSSSVRLQVWEVAENLIYERPLMGIGLGQYQGLYETRAEEILGVAPYEPSMLHPHNLWLSTWLNSGVLGLFGLCWLIVSFFYVYRRGIMSRYSRGFVLMLLAMFVVILLHSLVDQHFWKNDLALLWWMVVVSIFGSGNQIIEGVIVKGVGLGTKIGYPTINILMKKDVSLKGVYVCSVEVGDDALGEVGKHYYGAGFVGTKDGLKGQYICEVYLFGKCGKIYGKEAKVLLMKRIREGRKIKDSKELKKLIDSDVQFSKKYLKIN